jgi:hypothetical protein
MRAVDLPSRKAPRWVTGRNARRVESQSKPWSYKPPAPFIGVKSAKREAGSGSWLGSSGGKFPSETKAPPMGLTKSPKDSDGAAGHVGA